ncbi:MAG: hypothetical protein P4M08_14220 [Oligoflexia bacterium]|nr:hypothetical protein [Oligoflexia bacterium]
MKRLRNKKTNSLLAAPLVGSLVIQLATWSFAPFSRGEEILAENSRKHVYRVEEGETLGAILEHYDNLHRLWGTHGLVVKTWKMNRELVKHQGDFILPGTLILLPDELFAESSPKASPRAPASESKPLSDAPLAPVAADPPFEPVVLTRNRDEKWAEGSLTLTPTFSYFRITSTETSKGVSADLVSELSPGFDFKWRQTWSDSTQTFLGGGLESTKVGSSLVNKTISGEDNTLSHVELGVEQCLGAKLSVVGSIGAAQELTVAASSLTNVQVDENFYPKLAAGLSYRLLEKNHTSIDFSGGGFILLPVATDIYDVKLGSGYDLGIGLRQDLSQSWHLVGDAVYLSQTQNTSLTTQTLSEIRFSFGFSYSY